MVSRADSPAKSGRHPLGAAGSMDYHLAMDRHPIQRRPSRYVLCLAALLAGPTAMATTVYKTVDEKGRISFSDQPPPAGEAVEVLDYSTPSVTPSEIDTARLQAMRETTDRMAADRREREAHRAKLRTEAAAARTAANPQPVYADYYPNRVIVGRRGFLGPGYGRPPLLHPRPPTLQPPIARPPAKPGRPGYPLINRDVISRYNEYPATLIRKHYKGGARREFYGR